MVKVSDTFMVYDSLLNFSDRFDVFLFDASGVFWNAGKFFPGSREVMASLVKNGKTVYVLSNGTPISKDAISSYEKKGMSKGVHYNEFITSGEIARNLLLNGKLQFKNNKDPKNYYVFGSANKKLFNDTKYQEVQNPEDADFFYISVPQLTEEEKNNEVKYKDGLFESKLPKDGAPRKWDSINQEVFRGKLEKLLSLGIPAFNANPDLRTAESDKENNISRFVVRQGTIASMYREMGGEVVEIGKPHIETYEFVFNMLKHNGINVPKDRICMIGDTVRTDILGANNAGIKSILTVNTGIVANEAFKNNVLDQNILQEIFKREKGNPDFLIKSVSGILPDDLVNTKIYER